MTIETITKRIEGKEKAIAKIEKKIERINKAKATNWEVNPYYYSESDLKWAARDLENEQKALDEYKAMLITETEKANSRNIPAIIEFLNTWKVNVTKFYEDRLAKYPEARAQYYSDIKFWNDIRYFEKRKMEKENPEQYRELKRRADAIEAQYKNSFGMLAPYLIGYTFDWEKFNKELNAEADRKYDFIIERTNAITGTITDASHLSVGDAGDLNGYIIGERGTAKVQTIGAGGYNIQCFHFRTLINRMK